MDNLLLYNKLSMLPEQMKLEVADFIDFLLNKTKKQPSDNKKPQAKFGSGKGLFKIHADFDEPLDHFKEYMNLNG